MSEGPLAPNFAFAFASNFNIVPNLVISELTSKRKQFEHFLFFLVTGFLSGKTQAKIRKSRMVSQPNFNGMHRIEKDPLCALLSPYFWLGPKEIDLNTVFL